MDCARNVKIPYLEGKTVMYSVVICHLYIEDIPLDWDTKGNHEDIQDALDQREYLQRRFPGACVEIIPQQVAEVL